MRTGNKVPGVVTLEGSLGILLLPLLLLLLLAGFSRYEILGGFDGRPLEQETDSMVVKAWR